jgi:ketosteroid isomerase-like protein
MLAFIGAHPATLQPDKGPTMTRKFVFGLPLILALCALVAAQAPDARMGPRRKGPAQPASLAENQVLQVERDWGQAYITHDLAALETILSDDWTYTPADGSFRRRAQVLDDFRMDTMKYNSITHNDVLVRVYGDAAVVTGEEVVKGTDGAREITTRTRFTDVFIRRDDRWVVVATHETAIPEATGTPNPL